MTIPIMEGAVCLWLLPYEYDKAVKAPRLRHDKEQDDKPSPLGSNDPQVRGFFKRRMSCHFAL